ncbi:succinate dehydrogenase subunit 7B, mitochondrial-like [Bidens hawaiensis]|uniref:succinate dehydrogenase subunit 7B, mitochondrial-like n=1 Tax=Bidens hawaiensis TaxID=980011 RepID=UPI00404A08F8
MASFFKTNNTFTTLRSQATEFQSRRQLHVEPGAREKALLAKDPALERFKSYRKGAASIRRIGDYLTIAVVAGCCYEIYVRAVTREEARKALKSE